MLRRILTTTLLTFICVATVVARPNSPARVRAFATLPNWSGIWQSAAWPLDISGRPPGGEAQLRQLLQLLRHPPYNAEWQARYADELEKNSETLAARNASFKVCSRSYPALMEAPWMFEAVVLPEETVLIFENGQLRHIYTDGRPHPSSDDLWPTPLGDSIGHWEGETLVVDTIARLSTEPLAPRAWFSLLSERAHFTERLRLLDPNDIEDQLTVEDPVALAKPWTLTLLYKRVTEMNRMLPYDCTENDRNPIIDGKMLLTTP